MNSKQDKMREKCSSTFKKATKPYCSSTDVAIQNTAKDIKTI